MDRVVRMGGCILPIESDLPIGVKLRGQAKSAFCPFALNRMFRWWIGLSTLRFGEFEDDRWSPSKKRSDSHEAIPEALVGRQLCVAAQ
jgi:hypothetical protein